MIALAVTLILAAPSDGWTSFVAWQSECRFQGAAIGDADPRHPGLEGVGCDENGDVVLVRFDGAEPTAVRIYRHGAKLTGLLVADLDPEVEGPEIYASGAARAGGGGAIVQLCVQADGASARVVAQDDGFVHAMAVLPAAGDHPAQLAAVTYAGHVLLASPGEKGWTTRIRHREDPELGSEGIKLKHVRAGRIGDRGERTLVVAAKSGRCLVLDADSRSAPEVAHTEPGGIARLSPIDDRCVWLACNDGRVLRLWQHKKVWRTTQVHREIDELRGVTTGDFGEASLAICGYTGFCRLLVQNGRAWDTRTIYADARNLHWIAGGDLIRGNDADEILLASESGRLVVLAYRVRRATKE